MNNYTENDLREALRAAAHQAPADLRERGGRRVLPIMAAVVAASLIVLTLSVNQLTDGTPSDGETPGVAAPVDTREAATTEPPQDRLTLDDISQATGYEFRNPTPEDVPEVTEQDAQLIAEAKYSLGARLVGVEHVAAENGAQSPATITWRFVWVVASAPYEVTQVPSRFGSGQEPITSTQTAVSLVDARTGEIFRTIQL